MESNSSKRASRRGQIIAVAGLSAAALVWLSKRPGKFSFRGKTVVITGGSRGLGLQMARLWAAEGAAIALCARTQADVQAAVDELRSQGAKVFGQSCDVRDQLQVNSFIQAVIGRFEQIDVLVNNAGIIQTGPVECMMLDDYRAAMETHFWGPLYTMLAVLPHMRSRGAGRIVNISSIGGKVSVPHLVPYSASKFALVGLSEGLRSELAQHGIAVTTICPGLMRTGSPRNADFKGQHRAEYAWFSISDSLPLISLDSARAARQVIEACRRGDAEAILSLPANAAARFHGIMPGLTAAMLGLVNRLLPGPGGVGTQSRKGWQSFSKWSPSVLTTLTEKAAIANHEIR